MSTRSHLKPMPVIVNGDMSANIVSAPTVLQTLTLGMYQLSWSGASPVGTVTFQLSNDYSLDATGKPANLGTWSTGYVFDPATSTFINSVPITGNTGDGVIEFQTGANAIRIVYTATSGAGTLQAVISSKVA